LPKLAVTPPVVGSVKIEMYGNFASSSRASAAETFASCMRLDGALHHARPARARNHDQWLSRVHSEFHAARHLFSNDRSIEPPMKPNSIAQITTGRPFNWPSAVITASFHSEFFAPRP